MSVWVSVLMLWSGAQPTKPTELRKRKKYLKQEWLLALLNKIQTYIKGLYYLLWQNTMSLLFKLGVKIPCDRRIACATPHLLINPIMPKIILYRSKCMSFSKWSKQTSLSVKKGGWHKLSCIVCQAPPWSNGYCSRLSCHWYWVQISWQLFPFFPF